jgi:hypothetical protein
MAKVTACNADESQCVEAEFVNGFIRVTDSKDQTSDHRAVRLEFTQQEWDDFTDAVKAGKFDYDQLVSHSHATA